jgi:hypothetical protein
MSYLIMLVLESCIINLLNTNDKDKYMCILKLKGCILSFRSPPSKCNHWLDLEVLWPQNEALLKSCKCFA